MDNNDVLRQLIARMDNTTLSNVAQTPLWVSIAPLIDDYFWYLRSQVLRLSMVWICNLVQMQIGSASTMSS